MDRAAPHLAYSSTRPLPEVFAYNEVSVASDSKASKRAFLRAPPRLLSQAQPHTAHPQTAPRSKFPLEKGIREAALRPGPGSYNPRHTRSAGELQFGGPTARAYNFMRGGPSTALPLEAPIGCDLGPGSYHPSAGFNLIEPRPKGGKILPALDRSRRLVRNDATDVPLVERHGWLDEGGALDSQLSTQHQRPHTAGSSAAAGNSRGRNVGVRSTGSLAINGRPGTAPSSDCKKDSQSSVLMAPSHGGDVGLSRPCSAPSSDRRVSHQRAGRYGPLPPGDDLEAVRAQRSKRGSSSLSTDAGILLPRDVISKYVDCDAGLWSSKTSTNDIYA